METLMVSICVGVFFGIPILLIVMGYYLDYKRDKKYFISGLKGGIGFLITFFVFKYFFSWVDQLFDLFLDFFI
ncbi:MAG: hypothetical protein GY827_08770 [Cytophagales bacterium]|nr:hypothetical protein [Cytophagales bacterium]